MIYVCNLLCIKDEHRTLNEPIIRTLRGKKYILTSSADSSMINIALSNRNAKINKLNVKKNKLFRWVTSTYIFTSFLFRVGFGNNKVIFTSLFSPHYLVLLAFAKFFKTKASFLVFMHGELGYLIESSGIGQKIGAAFINATFQLTQSPRVIWGAIGLPIAEKLHSLYPELGECIYVFEHPPHHEKFNYDATKIQPIIGTFGVMADEKNSELIYTLSEKVDWSIERAKPLRTVGLASGHFKFNLSKNVEHYCSGLLGIDHVPWELFSSQCLEIDWALFFYNTAGKYGLTPSGILYDCIHWEIPILAIKNDLFKIYFEKYGDLGIMCDGIEDMALYINKINKGEINRDFYLKNIKNAKKDMSRHAFEKKINNFCIDE